MLKASGEGKKRAGALFAFIGATLGLAAIAGLAQRYLVPPPSPERPLPLLRTPEEQEQYRALIKKIRAQGRKQDWKGVVATTTPECSRPEGCSLVVRTALTEAEIHLGIPGAIERFVAPVRGADSISEADALALLNQPGAYLKHVESLLAAIDPPKATANAANNTAWAAILLPGKPPQADKVLALAERGVEVASAEERATFLNTLGVTLYRLGRYTDAISILTTTEKLLSEPFNWPFLAMAHKHAGNATEAKKWADRYRKYMTDSFGMPDRNRTESLLFLRELDKEIPRPKGGVISDPKPQEGVEPSVSTSSTQGRLLAPE